MVIAGLTVITLVIGGVASNYLINKRIERAADRLALLGTLRHDALARYLDTAKADGLVGERADGYLAAVKSNASAEIRELVVEINGKRKAQYQRIAQRNQIPLHDVEVLAGKKAIEKTRAGGWVFVENWRRK